MAIKSSGLLIDITRCIGCGACSDACKEINDLPPEIDDKLTAETWTVVREKDNDLHVRDLCRHCVEPACVASCLVAALTKTEHGPVIYDKSVCIGCRYCMVACPFQVPCFEWHSPNPRIRKCILCEPRVREGKSTGCAEACPTEATVFGDRETLVEMARARIKADPKRYHDHIYGLDEVGGTAVMFLSPVPFEDLDFNTNLVNYPLSDITWNILRQVPTIVAGGAVFLGASYWLFNRREKVKKAEQVVGPGPKKEADDV